MKIIRIRTLFVFGLAGLAGALLLHTSQSVQQAEDQLAALNESIHTEKESIQLLNAEWAYLNNPERLEKLSAKYLKLMPPAPYAMTSDPAEIPAPDPDLPPEEGGASGGDAKIQPASFQPPPPPRKPAPPAKKTSQDFSSLVKRVTKEVAP